MVEVGGGGGGDVDVEDHPARLRRRCNDAWHWLVSRISQADIHAGVGSTLRLTCSFRAKCWHVSTAVWGLPWECHRDRRGAACLIAVMAGVSGSERFQLLAFFQQYHETARFADILDRRITS